ncbi:MAG: cytochrome C biogenesis protein [Draconibacterium sp.]|nr:MAG: cytochrome C biogenesis protein [Draconibacterium sp.]PIF05632.1 MAG: cytochrome C biogenesis protein [Draconibacterium sp.]
MKKAFSFLFSMVFTGILVIIFAIAISYATFIENDFGTTTAQILIYKAKWFEGLLLLLSINLIGSIFQNRLIQDKKWPVFLFHFAFIIIAIGAAITRYYGYEGSMHIREGARSNTIISQASYIKVEAKHGNQTVTREKEVLFSPYTANRYSETIHIGGKTLHLKNLLYMPSTEEKLSIDPNGEPIISMLAVGIEKERIDFNLRAGDVQQINNQTIGFETPAKSQTVNLRIDNKTVMISSVDTLFVSTMNQKEIEKISPGIETELNTQKIYSTGAVTFAIKQFLLKGKIELVYTSTGDLSNNALKMLVSEGNESKKLIVHGSAGSIGKPFSTQIGDTKVTVSYGSKIITLPFSIALSDFQMERYPGSNSPSSYASEVVLKDGDMQKPFRIFMNNILKYKGYRFFQSSFDNDEKGTILSVNHDSLGTSVTYLGYLLMAIGMVLTLFTKNSRFRKLIKASAKLSKERKKLFVVIVIGLFFSTALSAQGNQPENKRLDKKHVASFSKLVIQSRQGRLEPVSTIASEILRKVAKKNSWNGMSPTAVFLDMQADPERWKNEPIIKIGNPELRKLIGATGKYVTFNSLVNMEQSDGYKLGPLVSAAYEKKSNKRNKLDKEVINVDERVNILMYVFSGNFLTIFPIPGHDNQKWVSVNQTNQLAKSYAAFARNTMLSYITSVSRHDWPTANQMLNLLMENQKKRGASIYPSTTKINLEVLYNNLNIFGKLSKIFLFTGLIMLILQLATIFNPNFKLTGIKKVAFFFILFLFIVETTGLAIRWYISGHAPWSNGYESMVFISWVICIAGLIFANRSGITLSLTTVLAGLTLIVAGMSWMSPEITNLVPVLKSYWLIVHVAVITASYGFLGISALLGFLNLTLMIFRNKKNSLRVNFTIRELVNIIRIAILIGLLMITVGAFLGAIWANESWGRYWGWDPKETWALVTILVYTFIGHMHNIPGFRGNLAISTASVLGISSVLMTYFGVNYYLSGLHSYAQGEPAPIPIGVYIAIGVVLAVIAGANIANKKIKADIEIAGNAE